MGDHVSYSQINAFLRCQLQWYFRWKEGIKIPPRAALPLGSSCHAVVERNYRQKMETRQDLPVSDVLEYYSARFDEIFDEEPEVLYDEGEDRGQLKDLGVGLVKVHHSTIAPEVQPVRVEEGFTVPMTDGLDLVGYWDLIDDKQNIIDNKFVSKSISQSDADKDLQLSIYSIAFRAAFQGNEAALGFDCVVKTKQPKAARITTKRTDDELRWVLNQIDSVVSAMNSGNYIPNDRGWHCSPKWCGYWDMCKGGKKI